MPSQRRRASAPFDRWREGLDPDLLRQTNTAFDKTVTMSDPGRSWGCVKGGINLPDDSRIVYVLFSEEEGEWRIERVSFDRPTECPVLF